MSRPLRTVFAARRSQSGASAVGTVLLLLGLAVVGLAAFTALDSVEASGMDCGSVISPKDPSDSVPKNQDVSKVIRAANQRCVELRSDQTRRATAWLGAGSVLLIGSLATPSVQRWLGRMRRRRRSAS